MAQMLASRGITLGRLLGVIVFIGLILLVTKCVGDSREAARQAEAIATAQGFAKVIKETLEDKTNLIVQEVNGTLEVTAVNQGTIFYTWQKSRVPYSVAYSVDLSRVNLSDIRYDESTKTMFVEIPEIVISPPNVDETRKVITGRGGKWTSRDAAENLAARSSKLAVAGAVASANQPEKVRSAREKARLKVDQLFEKPLRVAGKADVNVVVRFATDVSRDKERWDVSPSIEQVLARPVDKP